MAVASRARQHGHDVLLLTEKEGTEALHRAASGLVDGLLLLDVQLEDPRLEFLRTLGKPSVLIGMPSDTHDLICVDFDFEAAGALCVRHLADLGHQTVGFLGQPDAVYQARYGYGYHTLDGAKVTARQRGVTLVSASCPPLAPALATLMAAKPTGLVIHNESVLPDVRRWAEASGLSIPGDLSVIAVCPSDVAEESWPGIAHVALPASELCDLAVDLLMVRIEGGQAPSTTLLAPRLAAGSTVAAPGHAASTSPAKAKARALARRSRARSR